MARVPYREKSDMAAEDQDLFPPNINLRRALSNNPAAARAMGVQAMYLRHHSKLDPRLRELAILVVAAVGQNPYEWVHHVDHGRKAGITDPEIRAISSGIVSIFTPLERAILSAAREMTNSSTVADETFAVLQAGLDNAEIVDLIMSIGFYCGVLRILGALQIDMDVELAQLLTDFPLPAARGN
jgi:alkylhydroperoxidase family enzyme